MNFITLYASTSGNTEHVVEVVNSYLELSDISNDLFRIENVETDILINNSSFIFATSTWEHGRINPYWDKGLEFIKNNSMKNKQGIFIGLGDFRYEPVLFCKGIDDLKDAFINSGGTVIGTTLKINGDPYGQEEKIIKIWTNNIIKLINNENR